MAQGSIIRIGIVGAESTGKTWLCEALAKRYNTVGVAEYAREYFHNSDIYDYTLEDLVAIAEHQLRAEEALIKKANRFLFCDTTLITLKIWAELEFKTTPAYIQEQLAKIKYDYYFITDNGLPWVADALRQNKHSRDLLFKMNEAEVKASGTPFFIATGKDEERLNNAVAVIDSVFGSV